MISSILKLYLGKMWFFLKPFLAIFLSKTGNILAAAAIDAVKTVASSYGMKDGDEKRKIAFQLIESDMKMKGVQMGIDITTSMIFAAIEAAVQYTKVEK
jgi:hypothetical protein